MGNWLKAIAIAVAVILTAFASGLALLFHLAYFMMAIIVVTWLWSRINIREMQVMREVRSNRTQVGKTFEERFVVRNTSFIPKLWVELRDESTLPNHALRQAFMLASRSWRQMTVQTVCSRRGVYTLGPCSVTTGDPFGIFRSSRLVKGSEKLVVYPATLDLPGFDLPVGDLTGGQALRHRSLQITPMASGIREYVPGDGLNRIHWLYTARTGRLMTKEFESDPTSDIWIVLDLERGVQVGAGDEGTEEFGVTIAATLAKHFLDQNRSVGLVTYGTVHEVIHSDRGTQQLIRVLECLAAARAGGKMPLSDVIAAEGIRFRPGNTVIAISPSTDESWVHAMRDLLQRRVSTAAVILEANTFGGQSTPILLIGEMASASIPTFLVKRGDVLANVFVGTSGK